MPPRSEGPWRQKAKIGGNFLAGLQKNDVTRYDESAVDASSLAIPQDGGLRGEHPANSIHRLLGTSLLNEPDNCVGNHDRQDHARVDKMSEARRNGRRAQQHIDQEIVEVGEEPEDRAATRSFRKPVWPTVIKPLLGLVL